MKVYEILSEKKKPILVIFNFKFRLHKKLANGLERWCCTNKRCKSYLKRRDKNIVKNDGKFDVSDHNHKPALQQLHNDILLKDTEHTSKRPSMLKHNALKHSRLENVTSTDVNYVQKGNYEKCRKIIPSKPTNTQEVPKTIRSIDLETNEGPIAFSTTGSGTVYSSGLVGYKNNLVNLAVTWDRETGVFTCSCPGLYQFSFSGATEGNTRMVLQKRLNNSKNWSPILATEPGGGSATILLVIENGDQVAVYLKGNPKRFKAMNNDEQGIEVTSFSGHRISKS